jgi:RNA polymerase sigma factor (sigma-70 family)
MIDGDDILALYDAHARDLIGFFARRSADPQLALDLLSETFLTAFERRRSCRGAGDAERAAWLFAIASSKLAGHYRRGASERRATDQLARELRALTDPEIDAIERLAASSDRSGAAMVALGELSDDQRAAVRARVIDERPYAAMASELGISEPVARARVSRGLRAMRRALARQPERSDR